VDTSSHPSVFISHYNGHELSQLDHYLLCITLATNLMYPTVDSGLTITFGIAIVSMLHGHSRQRSTIGSFWATAERLVLGLVGVSNVNTCKPARQPLGGHQEPHTVAETL